VQQIFGRAGRPQFESSGHGIIITPMKTLFKYVSMLTRQAPIESCFYQKVHDNLNAEVVRGTVKTIDAAIDWIRYTYFFIRARLNPLHYGIDRLEAREDPTLHRFLMDICYGTARKLDACRMIHFDIEYVFTLFKSSFELNPLELETCRQQNLVVLQHVIILHMRQWKLFRMKIQSTSLHRKWMTN
jgi:hypothetical protein